MAKKSQSKPMKEILTRLQVGRELNFHVYRFLINSLQEFEFLKIYVFPEDTILKEPIDNWVFFLSLFTIIVPQNSLLSRFFSNFSKFTVDCLISFHSKGFPLEKAIKYAQLRNCYVLNNLEMQYDIQDRRKVYSILEREGIEIPRYAVLDRDSSDPKQHELVESEDHVEVNGIIFNKPFVEKPVSAEDHK